MKAIFKDEGDFASVFIIVGEETLRLDLKWEISNEVHKELVRQEIPIEYR